MSRRPLPDGFDAYLANQAVSLQSRIHPVISHFQPDATKAGRIAESIAQAYARTYPHSAMIFYSYLESLHHVDWTMLPRGLVMDLLQHFPSRAVSQQLTKLYQYSWPLELIYTLIKDVPDARVEVEPLALGALKKCDLFLYQVPANDLGTDMISTWPHLNGTSRCGLAIECKSLTSRNSLERRIDEAAEQLAPYGRGIVAIDVSAIVAKSISLPIGEPEFYEIIEREHEAIHDQVIARVEVDPDRWRHSIAGITIRCRLSCTPRLHTGSPSHYQIYEYNRCFGFALPNDAQVVEAVNTILAKAFGDWSGLFFLPHKDSVFSIEPGKSLRLHCDTRNNPPTLSLTSDEPEPNSGYSLKLTAANDPTKPFPAKLAMWRMTIPSQPGSRRWSRILKEHARDPDRVTMDMSHFNVDIPRHWEAFFSAPK